MENIKAQKLLNNIQRDLMRNGIITNTIVADLKDLRKLVVEENIPLLAKVTRLTYEHIAEHDDFLIAIPDDEPLELEEEETEDETETEVEENEGETETEVEENEEETETEVEETETEVEETENVTGQESLEYMLSLMAEHSNKLNEMELRDYVKALKEHAGEDY